MSKLYDQLAEEVFDTLKGNGKILSLFDKDGNRVFAPSKARRVFCQPDKMMVSLDENGEDSEVKMYLSQSTTLTQVQKLISTIRNICTRYNVLFNVRKFGKELCPRDFAYQSLPVSESVTESLWGSIKTSYDKIGTSKLVIRHSGPIDEEKRGSRTRHIKSIFIETAKGERFIAPTNLRAARALARHTSMGGTPYDELGNIITSLAVESKALSVACRHLRKSSLNESESRMLESIHSRMDEIREVLQSLSKPKKYSMFKESLLDDDSLLNEDEDLVNEVTETVRKTFSDNDKIRESIPYMARAIIREQNQTDRIELSETSIKQELVDVLQSEFGFKEGMDFSFSRTNPLRMTMSRLVSEETKAYLEEFHPDGYLKEVSDMENRLNIKPGMKNKALNVLRNIGGFREGSDYKIGGISGKIIPDASSFKEMYDLLFKYGLIVGSKDQTRPDTASSENSRRGIVFSKNKGVWEDAAPKNKIVTWCEKWLDDNMPSSSSALNTPGDDEQIGNRSKDLAKGIANFMTGKTPVDVKPVDDSRFRTPQDAYNFKVGEVSELHFDNDIFSNFLATIYDKLMHGKKLSGPEKQIADKAVSLASEPSQQPVEEKDLGKKGKNFSKIAKKAEKEYGSAEAGDRVAGAVLSKLRHEHPEEYHEDVDQEADADMNQEADDEEHLNISFPFDGDDKVAKVLSAYFDDLNVLSNNINDGRRNMVFNIPSDVDASGYQEKASSILSAMGVQDSEVSMSGDSDNSGQDDEGDQVNEFSGDENDWNGKSPSEGDMVSTPMGPGHVVEINGDEVKVEMMNGKIQTFHRDDVDNVNESINKQIDEWFAQFDPQNIFKEDENDYDDNSSVGVLTVYCMDEETAKQIWNALDGYHAFDANIEPAENDETTDETWQVTAKFYDADEMDHVANIFKNVDGVFDIDTSYEPVTEDEDGMNAADSTADQDSMNYDDSDLDDDAANAADSAEGDSVEEAFSDDPVGDADRYYDKAYGAQDKVDSILDKASNDFDASEFLRIYGDDFGMDNINNGYPEDYTVSDEEVISAISHYLTSLANRYSDEDITIDDSKPYAEDIFKSLKPELEEKGLIFSQNEDVLPGNAQTDFRKDVSNGHDPELERMKQLAGLNRR